MKAGRRWPDRHRYLGMVQSFTKVAEQMIGAAEDAVCLLTTDNGTAGRVADVKTNQTRLKGTCYDGGIHVPLLALGPDIEPGEQRGLASSVDLFATLLELAGLDPTEASGVDARSLVSALSSAEARPRPFVYAESPHARIVRTETAKLRVTAEADQLFLLRRDRREARPLTPDEQPQLHRELRAHLDHLFAT